MRLENVVIIGKRQYLQRAKTKAFWITTLILPLFVSAISIVPTLLLSKSKTQQKIVVVDETGQVGSSLVAKMNAQATEAAKDRPAAGFGGRRGEEETVSFDAETEAPAADRAAQRAGLDKRVMDKQLDAWVWIGPGGFPDKPV